MATSTINQIIKEIKDFQSAHNQIESIGIGRIVDYATSGDTKYPALWVDYGNTNVNVNTNAGSEYTTTLRVYIMDRLLKGGTNETEVLSDTQQYCLDLITYLSNSVAFDWILDTSITLNNVGDPSQDDEIAGHFFDLNFRQPLSRDRCAIPFSSDPTPTF